MKLRHIFACALIGAALVAGAGLGAVRWLGELASRERDAQAYDQYQRPPSPNGVLRDLQIAEENSCAKTPPDLLRSERWDLAKLRLALVASPYLKPADLSLIEGATSRQEAAVAMEMRLGPNSKECAAAGEARSAEYRRENPPQIYIPELPTEAQTTVTIHPSGDVDVRSDGTVDIRHAPY